MSVRQLSCSEFPLDTRQAFGYKAAPMRLGLLFSGLLFALATIAPAYPVRFNITGTYSPDTAQYEDIFGPNESVQLAFTVGNATGRGLDFASPRDILYRVNGRQLRQREIFTHRWFSQTTRLWMGSPTSHRSLRSEDKCCSVSMVTR